MRSTEITRLCHAQLGANCVVSSYTDVVTDVAVSPPACTPATGRGPGPAHPGQARLRVQEGGPQGPDMVLFLQVPGEVHQGGDAHHTSSSPARLPLSRHLALAQAMPPGTRPEGPECTRPGHAGAWACGTFSAGPLPLAVLEGRGGRRDGPGTSSPFLAAWPGRGG